MKKLLFLAIVSAEILTVSADGTYTWDAANPQPISTSDLTVVLDENKEKVIRLTATPGGAGRVVTIDGGKMIFADNAAVSSGEGSLRFENALRFDGSLSVSCSETSDKLLTYSNYVHYAGVKVAENPPEGGIETFRLTYAQLSGGVNNKKATVCNRKIENDVLSYQLQYVTDGSDYNKCAIIEFYLQDGDLYARTERCFYVPKSKYPVGSDVTAAYGTADYHEMNGEPGTTYTYMPNYITLRASGICAFVTATNADVTAAATGRVSVNASVSLTLPSVLACAASMNGGRLVYRDYADGSSITKPFVSKESGMFAVESTAALPASLTTNEMPVAQWTNGWHVIAAAPLSELTADKVSGRLMGSYFGNGTYTTTVQRFVNNGTNATFQLQVRTVVSTNPTTYSPRGALIELRQNGAIIEFRITDFRYKPAPGALGDDLSAVGTYTYYAPGFKSMGEGYLVERLTLDLPPRGRLLKITGSHIWTNTLVTVSGRAMLQAVGLSGLPGNGRVDVCDGGTLVVGEEGYTTFPGGGTCPIAVSQGGELIQLARRDAQFANTFPYGQVLTISGGTLHLGYGATLTKPDVDLVDTAGSSYVNNLTLSDGAVVTGHAARVGLNAVCTWKVGGSSPSVWEPGISLVGVKTSAGGTFNLDVEDVTGDAAADFTIGGEIRRYNSAGYSCTLVKSGDGTLLLKGFAELTDHPVRITGGAIALGADGVFASGCNLSLEGGGLVGTAGTVNSVGTVALTEDSPVAVEAGATLDFADSSAVAWTADKTLDVTIPTNSVGMLQGTVRFGTTADGLTPGQVQQVRLNGKRCRLTESGALEQAVGFLLLVR